MRVGTTTTQVLSLPATPGDRSATAWRSACLRELTPVTVVTQTLARLSAAGTIGTSLLMRPMLPQPDTVKTRGRVCLWHSPAGRLQPLSLICSVLQSRPWRPPVPHLAVMDAVGRALDRIALLICTAPVRWGVAIEVPLMVEQLLRAAADTMPAPGGISTGVIARQIQGQRVDESSLISPP